MIVPDILILQLAEELHRLQQVALAAIQVGDKTACQLALNDQIKVIDTLIELGKDGGGK